MSELIMASPSIIIPSIRYPLRLSPRMYFEADALLGIGTALPANATAVSTWKDLSGSFDLAQATGANQPIFNTNQIGKLPALTMSGNQWLSRATYVTGIFNAVIVTKLTSLGNQATVGNGGAANGWQFVYNGSNQRTIVFPAAATKVDTTPLMTTNWEVTIFSWSGAATSMYINGVFQSITNGTTAPVAPSGGQLTLGWNNAADPAMTGSLYAFGLYEYSLISAGLQTPLTKYFQNKLGF